MQSKKEITFYSVIHPTILLHKHTLGIWVDKGYWNMWKIEEVHLWFRTLKKKMHLFIQITT